jgi:hypothetical protein
MFEDGDIVLCIDKHDKKKEIINKFGIVRRCDSISSAIEFFENVGGHNLDCGFICENGYGWWVLNEKLIKINYLKGDVLREKGIKLQYR